MNEECAIGGVFSQTYETSFHPPYTVVFQVLNVHSHSELHPGTLSTEAYSRIHLTLHHVRRTTARIRRSHAGKLLLSIVQSILQRFRKVLELT